jgi:hypothetical protein
MSERTEAPLEPLTIHYHRDFDGMVSAAVLSVILAETRGETPTWRSVNYDQRASWLDFEAGKHFAVVAFHFHPRAQYWFDHHPTTFLTPEPRAQYAPRTAGASTRPRPLARRSSSGTRRALGLRGPAALRRDGAGRTSSTARATETSSRPSSARSRRCGSPRDHGGPDFGLDRATSSARWRKATSRASRRARDSEAHQRASSEPRPRARAVPPTVTWKRGGVLLYDASSDRIRRERFAAFYHHPDIHYSVGVIPTRAGFHVTAGANPWNPPKTGPDIGAIMERYGGGGHRAVGGANPADLAAARTVASEVAEELRAALARP